jgi:hypothetical protein
MEIYSYITYWVSEHQCLVPGHLDSVGMIMRILTMVVIIFTARCTEQIVCIGNVWYILATEFLELSPRHEVHYLRFLFFILSASFQRFGSRSVLATTLTCISFAEHEVLTHLIIRRYIIKCIVLSV